MYVIIVKCSPRDHNYNDYHDNCEIHNREVTIEVPIEPSRKQISYYHASMIIDIYYYESDRKSPREHILLLYFTVVTAH